MKEEGEKKKILTKTKESKFLYPCISFFFYYKTST